MHTLCYLLYKYNHTRVNLFKKKKKLVSILTISTYSMSMFKIILDNLVT